MDNEIRGFSIIELLVVLGIAAILIRIVSLSASQFITDASLSQMRDQLLQNIEEARSRSVTSVPYGIEFNTANAAANYTLFRFPGGTCSVTIAQNCAATNNALGDGCPAGEYCNFQNSNFAVAAGVNPTPITSVRYTSGYTSTLTFSAPATGNYIWFDRKGMPHDSSWNVPAGLTTIIVSHGAANKSITIDEAGKVTYEQ